MPRIEVATSTASPDGGSSPELQAWARDLIQRNREALAELDVAAGRHRGSCAQCGTVGLLYTKEPTDDSSPLVCAPCGREWARVVGVRQTLCDNDPAHGPAWRNPYTRRNEYLCGNCHAASPEGVLQNRYATAARYSQPLGVRTKALCEAAGVAGTKPCQGEVKPRGTQGVLLCNGHAGKQSASGTYFDD
jgi:hypothetical protein